MPGRTHANFIGDTFDISINFENGSQILGTAEFVTAQTDGDEVINEFVKFNNQSFWLRILTTRIENQGLDGFYVGISIWGL